MRILSALAFAALVVAGPRPAAAAVPGTLTDAQAQSVVEATIGYIEKLYVFPEKRAQIASALRADNAKGQYKVRTQTDLAERLSQTLATASNDKHLTVTFDPPRSKQLSAPGKPQDSAFFDAEGLRWNQGYVRQELLPGNIRYVRIRQFAWTPKVTPGVIDSAARFLAGGAAVIIDLRGNGGGHSYAVQRMISYLMPEKSTLLMTFFDGQTGKSELTHSTAKLPAPRIAGRPVYVLIDGGSASASEEFAYHIQQFKLGTLVGETTAGAANNNMLLPLPEGFVASVSYGRPIHPISKTNWEGVGIEADSKVPSPAALDAAVDMALKALSQSTDAQIKAEAEWEMPLAAARAKPVRVEPEALKQLAGRYGEREVRWTGEGLTVQRAGRPALTLKPLGGDLFAVAGIDDVRFRFLRPDAKTVILEAVFRDGRTQQAKREPGPG